MFVNEEGSKNIHRAGAGVSEALVADSVLSDNYFQLVPDETRIVSAREIEDLEPTHLRETY